MGADALMATLNAEIKKVDGEKNDAAPQKAASFKKDVAEESAEEETPSAAELRETKTPDEAVVTAVGKGETKEEAKLAAFRAAVEKAVGVYVDAESLMENSADCDNMCTMKFKVIIAGIGLKEVEAEEINGAYVAAVEQFGCRYEDILAVGHCATVGKHLKN